MKIKGIFLLQMSLMKNAIRLIIFEKAILKMHFFEGAISKESNKE